MKNKLLALLASLVVALGLTVAAGAPAHAVGWSGQRCDNQPKPGGEGTSICVQVHTVASTSGYVRIDQIQVCMTMLQSNNLVSGTHTDSWNTNAGNWGGLNATSKNSCSYTGVSAAAGKTPSNSCWTASGRIKVDRWVDRDWGVRGRVSGGAC